ncbi:hypothetical protein ALC60_08165, partial [Trachymyrmex zeteki]
IHQDTYVLFNIHEIIQNLAGIDDVKGKRRVRFAFLTDRTRQILTNIAGRARFNAKFEGRAAVRAEVVSAARLGDRLAIFQPIPFKGAVSVLHVKVTDSPSLTVADCGNVANAGLFGSSFGAGKNVDEN